MKLRRCSTSIFLLELMLDILIFFILMSFSMNIYIKSKENSQKAIQLNQAVTITENASALFISQPSDFSLLLKTYPNGKLENHSFTFYTTEDCKDCREELATYVCSITCSPISKPGLYPFEITVSSKFNDKNIYNLKDQIYIPYTKVTVPGGNEK